MTPNPGFKVTVNLQIQYLKNVASYGQSYYRKPYLTYQIVPCLVTFTDL